MFSIVSYIMSRVTHSEPGLPMVLISHRKAHLIDIQFPEIVLIVRKCAGKDGLNSTWKCTSALLNTIR